MRILLFKRANICYGVVNYCSEQIALQLKKHDISCDFLDITAGESIIASELQRLVTTNKYDAALAINAIGQEAYQADGQNLYDALGIPFYNLLLDHPTAHLSDLIEVSKDYHAICIDRDHVEFINRHLPHIRGAHFIPLGGIEEGYNSISFDDYIGRKYDIIFCGENKNLDRIEEHIMALDDNARNIIIDEIELFLSNRELSLDTILDQILNDRGISPASAKDYLSYAQTMVIAQQYCSAFLREEIIRYIAASGRPMHIFGKGWESIISEEGGQITLHNEVSFSDTAGLYRNSRFVLNIMPLFRNGCHDRIPTALLNGAAAFTDPTAYLKEIFQAGHGIYYYDISHPESIPDTLDAVISDPAAAFENLSDGITIAREKLSWPGFTDSFIKLLYDHTANKT